jgi:UDP-4-amino-4-deoxy-L-arabinose formyltransferase/UDP-glucuronic acid dehydrogenase (UDP-4-keto-hexauronic acid decarboxylating)
MHYKVTVFGVKDTTLEIINYIHNTICDVSLIVTINDKVLAKNHVAGFSELTSIGEKYNINIFKSDSYSLKDDNCKEFFEKNTFDIGISMGWQRLIPKYILDKFSLGIFGFHGSCGYLPYGRGRSPLNWSIIEGARRFILNLFQYDAEADSPNVFANSMFEINQFDTIRTLQYKQLISSKVLIKKLMESYRTGKIIIQQESKDFDSWYEKRTPDDGKVDFKQKTHEIYNLIRGVTRPFPGAFAYIGVDKITIWKAYPFDGIMDFSKYCPGEVVDMFDENILVRTIDGSLIICEYEYKNKVLAGNILQ